MDSHHLLEKPKFPGVARHITPSVILLPPTWQSSIRFPIHLPILNSLHKKNSSSRNALKFRWHAILFHVMILVHFVLLGPTFPCGDLQPTHKTHFFLCSEWWLSQLPELISPPMMAALCLVHARSSHYNPFLVFICPSELSTRAHLHEGWCIVLPILTAQYWLWEGQGALLKNLWTKSTNEERQAGGWGCGSPTCQVDDLSVLFAFFKR